MEPSPTDTLHRIQRNLQIIALNWLGKYNIDVLSPQQRESLKYLVASLNLVRVKEVLSGAESTVSDFITKKMSLAFEIADNSDTIKNIATELSVVRDSISDATYMTLVSIIYSIEFLIRLTRNIKSDVQKILARGSTIALWAIKESKKRGVEAWQKTSQVLTDSYMKSSERIRAMLEPIIVASKNGVTNISYKDLVEALAELQNILRDALKGIKNLNPPRISEEKEKQL